MAFDPNPLFYEMCEIYQDNYSEDSKVIICNEGSTRSSKTWDTFHLIYTFCDHNRGKENEIYILRDTLVNCKEKTFPDFKKCMKSIGANVTYRSENQKPSVRIFGNNIHFRGLESEDDAEGYPSDIIFVNEALETEKSGVNGLIMRCRKLVIMDWNPKYTQHWCFDLEKRKDTFFTRTTYKDNKHLQKSVIAEIERYEPWETGTYYIEDNVAMYCGEPIDESNQPPINKENVEQATADEFRWKVYGLGLRGAMKGLIFKKVTYIEEFPNIAFTYGMDFGFVSDPLAFGKYGREGRNIYLELLIYQPISTSSEVDEALKAIGVSKYTPITADSSDKYVSEKKGTVQMVRELFELGWEISKVSKTKGVMFWLEDMKNYKIHIVMNQLYKEAKIEQENYKYKEVNGILINQPVDSHNHFWDSCFVGDTMITTKEGETRIKDIKPNDLVLTSKGYRKVLNRWDNGVKEIKLYRLQFDTFCLSLRVTDNHKVKTNNGWIEISRLKQGTTVFLTNDSITKLTDYRMESGILTPTTGKCTGTYGSTTTGADEKDITYTILTETHKTIGLKTSKKSKLVSTCRIIKSNTLKIILNGLRNFTLKGQRQLNYGLKLPKAGNVKVKHLRDWLRKAGFGSRLLEKQNVNNVVQNLRDKQPNMTSARIDVNQRGEGQKVSTTLQGYANGVKKNGHLINTQKQSAAVKCVLVRIDSSNHDRKEVYDLHIEGVHEYFANGLLVHNCRYAHMSHDINNLEADFS